MKSNKSFKNLHSDIRQSFDKVKTKEIQEENKVEAIRFFNQTGERLAKLIIGVNENFENSLKERLQITYGKDFG